MLTLIALFADVSYHNVLYVWDFIKIYLDVPYTHKKTFGVFGATDVIGPVPCNCHEFVRVIWILKSMKFGFVFAVSRFLSKIFYFKWVKKN